MVGKTVWGGIDRLAFFENAILLELKSRAQGKSTKMEISNALVQPDETVGLYSYPVRDFLDDVALLVSGKGGKDNVTACCLEVCNGVDKCLVLRLARNAGVKTDILNEMRVTFDEVARAYQVGSCLEDVQKTTLSRIIKRCKSRVVEHAKELAQACRSLHQTDSLPLSTQAFVVASDHSESAEDIKELGEYCESTQAAYLQKQSHRLCEIQRLTAEVIKPGGCSNKDLEDLTNFAYAVRKSSTFRYLVSHRIPQSTNPRNPVPRVSKIVQRLGQLSKYSRAGLSIAKHMKKLVELSITLKVEIAPAKLIQIPELSTRNATHLQSRGGERFSGFNYDHLQNMIKRWPAYREHAEIQLLLFYEENPDKVLHSKYIGGNKQSCFMCFNFIVQHGRFQVRGCHQSLYSLWAIRQHVSCPDSAAAARIHMSLAYLSRVLEGKVEAQRSPSWQKLGFATGKESVASLSRTSLAFSEAVAGFPSQTEETTAVNRITDGKGVSAVSPMSPNLDPVMESDETISSSKSASVADTPCENIPIVENGEFGVVTRHDSLSVLDDVVGDKWSENSDSETVRTWELPELAAKNDRSHHNSHSQKAQQPRRHRRHRRTHNCAGHTDKKKRIPDVDRVVCRHRNMSNGRRKQRAAQPRVPCKPLAALRKLGKLALKVLFGVSVRTKG